MSEIESVFIKFKPGLEIKLKRFTMIVHSDKVNLSHYRLIWKQSSQSPLKKKKKNTLYRKEYNWALIFPYSMIF